MALNPGASPQSRGEPSIQRGPSTWGRSNFLYAWESTLWGVALNPAWAFDLERALNPAWAFDLARLIA